MEDSSQQLTIIRTFNFPVDSLWKAWTTPEGWVEWYGKPWEVPKDLAAMDLKVEGRWKSTTIAQGQTINFEGEYKEIQEPNRLVFIIDQPADSDNPTNVETVSVDFKDMGEGKTEMTFNQSGNLPPQEYQTRLKEGWSGFFDALEKYLEK